MKDRWVHLVIKEKLVIQALMADLEFRADQDYLVKERKEKEAKEAYPVRRVLLKRESIE